MLRCGPAACLHMEFRRFIKEFRNVISPPNPPHADLFSFLIPKPHHQRNQKRAISLLQCRSLVFAPIFVLFFISLWFYLVFMSSCANHCRSIFEKKTLSRRPKNDNHLNHNCVDANNDNNSSIIFVLRSRQWKTVSGSITSLIQTQVSKLSCSDVSPLGTKKIKNKTRHCKQQSSALMWNELLVCRREGSWLY